MVGVLQHGTSGHRDVETEHVDGMYVDQIDIYGAISIFRAWS
jgi:hypothetical protein